MNKPLLPSWASEVRAAYLRGESSVFVLYGNVHDRVLVGDQLLGLIEFLSEHLLRAKGIVAHCNPSIGVELLRKDRPIDNLEALLGDPSPEATLPALERLLHNKDRVGVILDYSETVVPAGQTSFMSDADRRATVTLHRWSLDRRLDAGDNIVLLITEHLDELAPKLVANPKITSVEIPLPDAVERRRLIDIVEKEATDAEAARLASLSAGLKCVQIQYILSPRQDASEDHEARVQYIERLLDGADDAQERAAKLADLFAGQTYDEIKSLIRPGEIPSPDENSAVERYEHVYRLMDSKKRAILERECFGLIEFIDPDHDFESVGGLDVVKAELCRIADAIKGGDRARVPMGLLFTGPMGTGKTFVAEAFAKSSGLTAIKLKNFRSKWVGSTESNLDKILSVVKAIGNTLVMIDEGDRAFGSGGEGDGGTGSRVIAKLKAFMSDPTNRGRVLFVLMTNRPDKLDIDLKRAGRLDKKIPFFYSDSAEEIEPVVVAQLKRHDIEHSLQFPRDRATVIEPLVGYSNADIEGVVLLANEFAHRQHGGVRVDVFESAIEDYLPSRDRQMHELMELLAVFESSSRGMLPGRYKDIEPETLQARIHELRLQAGA